MKKHNDTLLVILILTFLLMIAGLLYVASQNQKINSNLNDLQYSINLLNLEVEDLQKNLDDKNEEIECLLGYVEYSGQYAEGEIMVGFEDGLTESEASDIISNAGLSVSRFGQDWDANPWILVNTPKGDEIKWVCKISVNDGIDYAELNGIVFAA